MTLGDVASGTKRLETVIDFQSEEFEKAWNAASGEMLKLGAVPLPLFSNVAYPVILEVVLRSDVEHTALDAFTKTDMAGAGWSWNFYLDDLPTDVVEVYRTKNPKLRIVSTARWRTSDAGEYGKFLTANIGDYIIEPKED